jgi:hypothetical protein
MMDRCEVHDPRNVGCGLRAVLDYVQAHGHACCECVDNAIWDHPIGGLVEIFQSAAMPAQKAE